MIISIECLTMEKVNMLNPVIRFPGSKFKKVGEFIQILEIVKEDKFLDMFGGSGIVGVNFKYLTDANVTINDFDNLFPLTPKKVVTNLCSFGGLGLKTTKAAEEYFYRRVRNNYWSKYDKFNDVLAKCNITKDNFEDIKLGRYNKIYVDPPYDDIKGLYKQSFTKEQHISLCKKLSKAKADILISYNDTPFIRELYKGKKWNITEMTFRYGTGGGSKKKKVNELIITNF